MKRLLSISIVLLALLNSGCKGDSSNPSSCCKICSKSKACGNSCISQAHSCSKPSGCACDS